MNGDFQEALASAVAATGAAYIEAREVLVRTPAYDVDLRMVVQNGTPWGEVWVARMALARREQADLVQQVEAYINGELPGRPPITGQFPLGHRVEALVQLGPEAAVPLVEAVWKTKAYDDALRLGVVFGALRELGLPETAPPLRPLLSPGTPPAYRHPAIVTLGALRDMASIGTIKDIALNPGEPERIRIAALSAYAEYDQDDLFRILESLLLRPEEPLELRKEAAVILNRRRDPGTRDLYHALIRGGKSEEALLRTVVDGLRFHGTAADTVPILEQLKAETDADSTLQPIIEDAIEWLTEQ